MADITNNNQTNNPPVNTPIRRAWIMSDYSECGGVYKPKEILVDFNNGCNIYIIDPEGKPVSPTRDNLTSLKNAMREHMTGTNQHLNATDTESGFLSSEGKKLLDELSKINDYIIENPYVELNSVDNMTKGFIKDIDYNIEGNKFIINNINFSFKGYTYIIPTSNIEIGERKDEYYEELIYLSIVEDLSAIGRNKYKFTVVKDEMLTPIKNEIVVPMFILRRCNNKKFSSSNPFGFMHDDCILDKTEIIPEWYLLMDHTKVVDTCKKFIDDNNCENANIQDVVNLHFGLPHLPVTENTLVMIDVNKSKAIDFVSGTDVSKDSIFTLSPTGLALSKSLNKGTNLPISLKNTQFTIEFLLKTISGKNQFIDESIISLNDNVYNNVFSLKIITKDMSNSRQDLYVNYEGNDILILENVSKEYNMYKLIYDNGKLTIKVNEVSSNNIDINIDISKISFFELSSLNVPICDVRMTNISLDGEDILPKDIHYNKGYMLPPLIRGCRKVSNGLDYIFNSVRLNYTEIGLMKDKNGIAWHKGDSILLNKNENEIISGVYNTLDSNAMVTGIKGGNSLYVDSTEKLSMYDTIKIVKFNKNLFKIFKILDIDKTDNSIKVIDVTNGSLTTIEDLNESYIYAKLYDSEVSPSIEVKDLNGKVINIVQYPDSNGNVKIQLLEDAVTDDVYISYILCTNYGNVIPTFSDIKDVYLNNVLCEEVEMNNIKIDRDKITVLDDVFKPITGSLISKYSDNGNPINLTIRLPLEDILVSDKMSVVEDSIISTILDSVNIGMDIANSSDLTIYTAEQSLLIPASDTVGKYNLKFISTDKTVENNNFVIRIKMPAAPIDMALLLDNISVSLNLKECSTNEKVYRKVGSNKIDDMVIVSVNNNDLYIKTILNTNDDTDVLVTVYKEMPTVEFNSTDRIIESLEHNGTKYLIMVDNDDIVYMAEQSSNNVVELPNKIKLKGGSM